MTSPLGLKGTPTIPLRYRLFMAVPWMPVSRQDSRRLISTSTSPETPAIQGLAPKELQHDLHHSVLAPSTAWTGPPKQEELVKIPTPSPPAGFQRAAPAAATRAQPWIDGDGFCGRTLSPPWSASAMSKRGALCPCSLVTAQRRASFQGDEHQHPWHHFEVEFEKDTTCVKTY